MKTWLLTLIPLAALAVAGTVLLGGRPALAAAPLAERQMTVTKSPLCGCCGEYIAILRQRGALVTVIDTDDIAGAKSALGVPPTAWSCHTTEVGGYAVEGHVPLEAIERLLGDKPNIVGIGLPGMPPGSPGMAGVTTTPFQVFAFGEAGVRVFGAY